MAKKKPRTPTPPRRVQAPATRTSSRSAGSGVPIGDLGLTQRAILYGVAGSLKANDLKRVADSLH